MLNGMVSSVGGKVNTSSTNLTVDSDAIFASTSANNIAIGLNALNSTAADSDGNIANGLNAGTALTTGDENVAIGYVALSSSLKLMVELRTSHRGIATFWLSLFLS